MVPAEKILRIAREENTDIIGLSGLITPVMAPFAATWAMYIANAENQGIPKSNLGGTIQNDILKEYIAQKEYIFPRANTPNGCNTY